jgi:adenylate kinase
MAKLYCGRGQGAYFFRIQIALGAQTGSQLLDELEPVASNGGLILDWHTCGLFPERWIDLVVVLRCDHTMLWERMEARYASLPSSTRENSSDRGRGYKLNKIQENNDAEIMNVVLDEARESYAPEIVVELTNESTDELEANVGRIVEWINEWLKDHPSNE